MRLGVGLHILRNCSRFFHPNKMPLKFSANVSLMFTEHTDMLERYKAAKQSGFHAVECAFPYDVPADKLSTITEELDIEQTLINSYMGNRQNGDFGLAAIPGREMEFQESVELSIKYCKALKCKRLHVMSGLIPPHEDGQKPELLQKMEVTFVKNLKEAVPRLEKEGILALIEPINTRISVPRYYMNTLEKAVRIMDQVGHKNLKLQFDFFHIQIMHGNLTKYLEEHFHRIGYIQVSQPPHRGEPDSPGEVDFKYVFSLLEKMGYDGWIGAEYKPTGKTADSLKWFEKFKP